MKLLHPTYLHALFFQCDVCIPQLNYASHSPSLGCYSKGNNNPNEITAIQCLISNKERRIYLSPQ